MPSFDSSAFDTSSFDTGSFDLAAGAPAFTGSDITTLSLTVNVAMSPRDYSPKFTAAGAMTYTLIGGPVTGLSLSSAGVLSGTPTVLGTTIGLKVRASDGTDTADSNTFAIVVQVAPSGGSGGVGSVDVGSGNVGRVSVGSAEVGG